MKRLTVTVSDELGERLEQERQRRDVSAAGLIRDALDAYLPACQSEREIPFAALGRSGRGDISIAAGTRLPFVGMGRSAYTDTARNIDAILDEEWGRAGRG